ncbi:serine hydrolase [[Actinomadura] parvosata]|uniref:serine hydrolase n=1 Tax=[Actinomadura] parvosata TaxID=1955412 RepID=UPI00406D15C2
MHTPSKPVRVLAAAAAAIALTACAGGPVHAGTTDAPIAATPEIPSTPAGRQLGWLLDAVTRAPVSESELAGHFTAAFLKSVPPAQINQSLAGLKGVRLERVVSSKNAYLVAQAAVGAESFNIVITVDAAGLMAGLMLTRPDPRTWAELDERLRAISPQAGFLAAELAPDGTCRPAHAVAARERRPLGSMIKLYVLGAVAERVKSGALDWDTKLTIRPELKSLPSGELQNRPDGSKVTVLEAAKLMISISDNTATDLLIHKVGRKAVERTMRAWGVRDERNVPLLTTRDLFVLKGAGYPGHAKRYLSLGDAKQRAYLEKVVAAVPLSKVRTWTEPRELGSLEWYAAPEEVCRAYAGLVKLGDRRIGEIMSINDAAVGLDPARWPVRWYKGGSEPGVSDLSFLARTPEGKAYVVTTMAADPGKPLKPQTTDEQLGVVRAAFGLVQGS